MGKIVCETCKKKCKKEAVKLQERYYHLSCFCCKACQKQLAVDGFYTKDNAHYCAEDYRRLFATKCKSCGELAEGNVITVLGETYHEFCFQCSNCGKKFEPGEKVTVSNKNHWCRSCLASDGNRTKSPSKSMSLESPPKPPRAKNTSEIYDSGLTPTTDKSGYSSSNGMSPEIAQHVSLTSASPSFDRSESRGGVRTSKSLPRFGTPDNRFYNISYLERSSMSEYKRAGTSTSNPKDPAPKHFHRPDNFSYTSVRRDYSKPEKYRAVKQETPQESRQADGGLAPIERDDWPGPPEPAAAYPELFREKPSARKSESDGRSSVDGGLDVRSTARSPAEELKIAKEISELSKMTDSGAATMILRDLRKKRSESPTLDPRNASRTPSAAVEPLNRPRYETPYFASPSRDLDMLTRCRSRSTDNTMSRSTPPSRNGIIAPRPGYGLKCVTPDLKYSYQLTDDVDTQPRRPQSSAANLQTTPRSKTPTEDYDPNTGLRHSSHLRTSTLLQGLASHNKYVDSILAPGSFRSEDPPKIYHYDELRDGRGRQLLGVDQHALERHLPVEEFEQLFKMPATEFYRLPEWKRNDEKVRVGLL